MVSDGNIPSLLALSLSSSCLFLLYYFFLWDYAVSLKQTQLPVADVKEKTGTSTRGERETSKKWLLLTSLLIWHWIIYYISLVRVVDGLRDDVRKRQWNGKDNKDDRLILLYDRATMLLSLSLSILRLLRRISMTCIAAKRFFLMRVHSQAAQTGMATSVRGDEQTHIHTHVNLEGQENRTQLVYNLVGQRVDCQYENMSIYWLWITVWSEVQIGVDEGGRERKKQKRTNGRKTNLMKLVIHIVIIWSSFTYKQGHRNEGRNGTGRKRKVNVTSKPDSVVFHQD